MSNKLYPCWFKLKPFPKQWEDIKWEKGINPLWEFTPLSWDEIMKLSPRETRIYYSDSYADKVLKQEVSPFE